MNPESRNNARQRFKGVGDRTQARFLRPFTQLQHSATKGDL